MKKTYLALVHEDETGKEPHRFGVSFPDLDCVTEGDSISHALCMAEDLLVLTLQGLTEMGKAFPVPTMDVKALVAKADPDMGPVSFVMPVTVFVESEQKTVHINITCPEDKLAIIDQFVHRCGAKRSTFLIDAAMEKIARMSAEE